MSKLNGKAVDDAGELFGSSSLDSNFKSSGLSKETNLKPSSALTLELDHIDPSYGRHYGEEDDSIGFVTPESEKSVRIFDTNPQHTIFRKPKVSRSKSFQRSLSTATRKTMGFLNMRDDLTLEKQEKWRQLRKQHLEKLGKRPKFVSKSSTNIDAIEATEDGQERHARNLNEIIRMAQPAQTLQRRKRENAVKVLWKAGIQSISTKPRRDLSTYKSYGGRSYAPSDLVGDDDISVFSSSTNLDQVDGFSRSVTPMMTPVFKDSFFQFDAVSMKNDYPSTIAEERPSQDSVDAFTPGESIIVPFSVPYEQPVYKKEAPMSSAFMVPSWDTEALGAEPSIRAMAPGEIGKSRLKPDYDRGVSRGGRLMVSPEPKRKKKYNREFGKGFVGNLLNRTLDRRVINSAIERQFEEVSNHRPYFTYWLSFVQVVIVIVMVSLYPFAPIGVSKKVKQEEILISRNGVAMEEYLSRKVQMSIWLGPKIETLIKLGAKYAPCMRKDKKIYAELEKEHEEESKTGCCMQSFMNGCIQRSFEECSSSATTLALKKVCGQDPKFCAMASIIPQKWDKDTITKWPICRKKKDMKHVSSDLYPHMTCEVTGHPCCINTQGQCVITTEDNCRFREGIYHPDAYLCSQVACLESTCGMLGFSNDGVPDQFYRLILSLFLNAGILHLLVVLVFNFTVLRDIEVMAGWLRTALIFILSGIGGNLWSAILIPYEPEVGELGASFGILSCLFVEVIQGWKLLQSPGMALGKLFGVLFLLLLFGLLPYIDNFAHIFGFVYGFFLSFILLPYVITDTWDKRRKQIQTVLSFLVVTGLTVLGFVLFYNNYSIDSSVIRYLNCVPITKNFCSNFHQGSILEARLNIEY